MDIYFYNDFQSFDQFKNQFFEILANFSKFIDRIRICNSLLILVFVFDNCTIIITITYC